MVTLQVEETSTKSVNLPKEGKTDVTFTRSRRKVTTHNCDIIGDSFWDEHPDILEEDS